MSNLDLIRGRQVVAYLTNKSGGAVVAGDVVIMDGSNDESFTTTTSASSLKKVGVAQESIANNAAGRVLVSGYASLVNVSASATRDYYLFTHTVAKQATSSATFAQGAFGHVIKAGTSPSALIYDETAQASASIAATTVSENFITGDVNLTSADTFYTGPSLSLAAGTYVLMGSIVIYNTSGVYVAAKLWDGTTTYDSPGDYAAAGTQTQIAVHGTVVLGGTTTLKISGAANGVGSVMLASVLNGVTNKASHLVAMKIA